MNKQGLIKISAKKIGEMNETQVLEQMAKAEMETVFDDKTWTLLNKRLGVIMFEKTEFKKTLDEIEKAKTLYMKAQRILTNLKARTGIKVYFRDHDGFNCVETEAEKVVNGKLIRVDEFTGWTEALNLDEETD